MMTKEEFLDLYKSLDKFIQEGNKLESDPILNTDFMIDFIGFGWKAIDKTLGLIMDKEGTEWIYWWFFEKPRLKRNLTKAIDASGIEIPTETPEDLWNIIEKCLV